MRKVLLYYPWDMNERGLLLAILELDLDNPEEQPVIFYPRDADSDSISPDTLGQNPIRIATGESLSSFHPENYEAERKAFNLDNFSLRAFYKRYPKAFNQTYVKPLKDKLDGVPPSSVFNTASEEEPSSLEDTPTRFVSLSSSTRRRRWPFSAGQTAILAIGTSLALWLFGGLIVSALVLSGVGVPAGLFFAFMLTFKITHSIALQAVIGNAILVPVIAVACGVYAYSCYQKNRFLFASYFENLDDIKPIKAYPSVQEPEAPREHCPGLSWLNCLRNGKTQPEPAADTVELLDIHHAPK